MIPRHSQKFTSVHFFTLTFNVCPRRVAAAGASMVIPPAALASPHARSKDAVKGVRPRKGL